MPANPEKLRQVRDFSTKGIVTSIALNPKKKIAYLGSSDFKVYSVDLTSEKPEPKELFTHGAWVTGVALLNEEILVSGGYDGKLSWYDLKTNQTIKSEEVHAPRVRSIRTSPNGKQIASVGDDMICRVWDAQGKKIHELKGHAEKTPQGYGSMLFCVEFSADGKYLATADKIGKGIVWELESGKKIAEVEAPIMYTWEATARLHSIGGVRSVAFSHDGKTLALGGTGKIGNIDHLEAKARIETFEIATQKKIAEFVSDKGQGLVNRMFFSKDSSFLIGTGGAGDGFLMVIDPTGKKILKQEKVNFHVHDLAMADDFETFVLVGHNKAAIWEMKG
jgi:WD40 repeat protein